jgi:hypothetical protein
MHRSIQLPKKSAILYAYKTIPIINNKNMKTSTILDPTFVSSSPPTSFMNQLNKRMDVYYKSPLMEE